MVLEFYSQDSYGAYVKSEMAGTLRNAGGDCGNGSETLIVQTEVAKTNETNKRSGALREYDGWFNQRR